MTGKKLSILYGLILLSSSGLVFSEEITREEAAQLMEECQKQREENIAPLREQAIEDCVTKQRRDREYCERFNRTFGNARPRGNGSMIPGLFWDLPVCQKADAADRYFRANPGRQIYTSS
jgi:hypothetical protein